MPQPREVKIMAMKTIKTNARELSVSGVKFVAFTNVSGVYPDVLVWERTDSGWAPVAWVDSPEQSGEISSEDLELELMTSDGGAVLLGEDCTRQQFYEFVFGSDSFADSAFTESEVDGFESDVWFPAQFEAPNYLKSDNGFLVEYHDGLNWEESESEVRKDLDSLNEHTHVEMYGHSYRA